MESKRNIYLDMMAPDEALELFLKSIEDVIEIKSESIGPQDALDRITAKPLHAKLSSPAFHTAAMDGFAVKSSDTFGAGPGSPKVFRVPQDASPVNTGRPIPPNTDSVIMIEDVNFKDETTFEIDKALSPWKNVRRVGEDFVATEMILPSFHKISPYDMAALLAGGLSHVEVVKKPKVAIIPTGSELFPWQDLNEQSPQYGQTVEYNSILLGALVEKAGAEPVFYPIAPDEFPSILKVLKDAAESDADIIVINAGSSAGSEDYTAQAIKDVGRVLAHGVAMMPGKPTILGAVKGKPVIGNPGYPVSAALSFEMFGLPLIARMTGSEVNPRPVTRAQMARKVPSKLGRLEFFRVKLGQVGDRIIASPLPRGAGSITTLTKADGIIRIPAKSEGIDQTETLDVELLRDLSQVGRTVVIIGSHDLTLDTLADLLAPARVHLSSSHVGSLGGLLALKKGAAHMATSHLLDPETGEYNWPYIRKYIKDIPVRVFNCVMREQGLITLKGNPKGINSFKDLVRDDVNFINRQAGAGTRVLLDHHLSLENIDPSGINGYDMEEYTHTSVAVAILSGVADVGMGVLAAARALDLEFIPVCVEQYDLVIAEEFMEEARVRKLLDILSGKTFRDRVLAMGGYGVDKSGMEILP
jgi:putative molybdopterin biosynthesis protein